MIGRNLSYHGTTLATLAVGGNAKRRAGFEPYLFETPRAIDEACTYAGYAEDAIADYAAGWCESQAALNPDNFAPTEWLQRFEHMARHDIVSEGFSPERLIGRFREKLARLRERVDSPV